MTHLQFEQLSRAYPHVAQAFASIPDGEAHLQHIQDLNSAWQQLFIAGGTRQYAEVVVTADYPAFSEDETFDLIYAGGGLNLLHAAVMFLRYGFRVLVFDRFTVGAVHREWNISREELEELLAVGLLSAEELATVIQREYSDGLVSFSPRHIRVPEATLHLKDVLNVAVDAEKLTALCVKKILTHRTASGKANVILNNTTFMRCNVQPAQGAAVTVMDAQGAYHTYGGRLLVDGMGSTSPIACQLNCGRPFSLVCPTVGTVARGYRQGHDSRAVNQAVGEVLISTSDVNSGRQLIWETFPGSEDRVAIYLFHYAESGSPVDLLKLFDDFFALLPTYKDTSAVEVIKPVYGFIPAGYNITLPWQKERKVLAYDRVISLGDAAAFQSPLTFCGFGSYVRNLRRVTSLLHMALETNCLSASDLSHVRASEAVPAVARAFSKFLIARPAYDEPVWQVNETMNVFCRVLADLGPRITNDFFKDRIGWLDYTRLVLRTPRYYPQIYTLALKTLTPTELIGWFTAWLQLGRQSAIFTLYRVLKALSLLPPLILLLLLSGRFSPHVALHVASWHMAMEQVARARHPGQARETSKRRRTF